MSRTVDEVGVVATISDRKQEVIGHSFIGVLALILDVSRVDIGLREGP